MKKLLIILFCFPFSFLQAQKPALISSQDDKFPLYTSVSTFNIKKCFENYDDADIVNCRTYLRSYAWKGDPLAQFYYAQVYDLAPYGLVSSREEIDTAFYYYHKAAEQHLALAEEFLCNAYHYNLLGIPSDATSSLHYLNAYMTHGSTKLKVKAFEEFAKIYDGEYPYYETIKPDSNKVVQYLEMAIALDPKDSWAIDFLAEKYEKQGKYDKAITLMVQSDNIQGWLKAAEWMIEGKKVAKDIPKGLQLIYVSIEQVNIDTDMNMEEYMGAVQPIYFLNELYKCRKLITKEQVGKYLMENYQCH